MLRFWEAGVCMDTKSLPSSTMSPLLFAVPALAMVFGLGGGASAVEAHAPWKHLSDEQKADLQTLKETFKEAREEHRAARPVVSAENRAAITAALESGDYQAFVDATVNAPFADRVTEEKFDAIVEALELRAAGDREGAREVLKDAGMHKPTKMRSHRLTPPVEVETENVVE